MKEKISDDYGKVGQDPNASTSAGKNQEVTSRGYGGGKVMGEIIGAEKLPSPVK